MTAAALAREVQLANAQLNRVNGDSSFRDAFRPWPYQRNSNVVGTGHKKAADRKTDSLTRIPSQCHQGIGNIQALANSRRSTRHESSHDAGSVDAKAHEPGEEVMLLHEHRGYKGTNFAHVNRMAPAFQREKQLALTKHRLLMPRMNTLVLDKEMPSWFTAVNEVEFNRKQYREQLESEVADMADLRRRQRVFAEPGRDIPSPQQQPFPHAPPLPTYSKPTVGEEASNPTRQATAVEIPRIKGKQRKAQQSDKAVRHKLDVAMHMHEERSAGVKARNHRSRSALEIDHYSSSLRSTPLVEGLRRPPFAVETPQFDKPANCENSRKPVSKHSSAPASGETEDQFAWWSKFWADKLNPNDKNVPIHPVETMWLGNFQKRPVPWRKEQLGTFPAFNDFPWPPPQQNEATKRQMDMYVNRKIPYGRDTERFKGPEEVTMNALMRDSKATPAFIDPQGDLEQASATVPLGKSWRSHANVGWNGYKQRRPEEKYDPINRRIYTENFERLLGIITDKLEAQGVSNFFLAFAYFDHDRSGYIDQQELQAFLSKYNINLTDEEFTDLLTAFEDDEQDSQISYTEFVNAIEGKARAHPLRVNYTSSGFSGGGKSITPYP